jgi:hypothetical protein
MGAGIAMVAAVVFIDATFIASGASLAGAVRLLPAAAGYALLIQAEHRVQAEDHRPSDRASAADANQPDAVYILESHDAAAVALFDGPEERVAPDHRAAERCDGFLRGRCFAETERMIRCPRPAAGRGACA